MTTDIRESEKIWNEIKDLQLDLFSLPDQRVCEHVQRLDVMPNAVYGKLKSSAVFIALEVLLQEKFLVEQREGDFVMISRRPSEPNLQAELKKAQKAQKKL